MNTAPRERPGTACTNSGRTDSPRTSRHPDPPRLNDTLNELFKDFQGERTELIPVLQAAQNAVGYLPRSALSQIARFTLTPLSTVYGVATFYAQFYLSPQGKHKIKVCQGTACHVRGGKAIMDALRRKLSIEPGGTTEDLMFSLERVACFGSCALAPVLVADSKVYGRMTSEKAAKVIDSLE